MALPVFCILLVTYQVVSGREQFRNDGFMNKLSNGMKFAKDFLGSESVALKVAEFVVRAFQTANTSHSSTSRRRPTNDAYAEEPSYENDKSSEESRPNLDVDEVPTPMTPLRHLVRLFGLQPNQISAVAVNALVFVAQMISTFLTGPKRSKPYRSEDPTSWILNKNSMNLQNLITAAKNESLPENIEELIKEQGSAEETSCIRLLVCKITPFVIRMQKAVFGRNNPINDSHVRGSAIMYRHLPSAEEINHRSDICERRHIDCHLNE